MKEIEFLEIIRNFQFEGSFQKAISLGSGHIHDTYLIKTKENTAKDYVLQKINNKVFLDVDGLMNNIKKVTLHIQKKTLQDPELYSGLEVLEVIPTKSGTLYFADNQNKYWRLFNHIPDSISFDRINSPAQAYQEGKAFGQFQALLQDLSPDELVETIPDFHNVEKRLETFNSILLQDPCGRAEAFSEEIHFIKERVEDMSLINKMFREGKLGKRITHNDTKLNNVLFNNQGDPLCVIDLDTVMPGFVAYDFGDAIRTTINSSQEDEADLNKISINMLLYEAFSKGFLSETSKFLTSEEKSSLAFGAKLLTFLMGLRFFTDHLNGDQYYKIQFPNHNLQRARAQFQLLRKMEKQYDVMQNIIKENG